MKTEERIGRVMLAYDKRFKLFMKQELARVPLNAAEGMVLLALYGHDGQTQEEILTEIHRESCGKTQEQLVSELHYDKSVMARTMQSLEGKGYIH
ncbi:MAG: hypothetical protein RR661_08135, partial [Anaerovoracaceae bacterium]